MTARFMLVSLGIALLGWGCSSEGASSSASAPATETGSASETETASATGSASETESEPATEPATESASETETETETAATPEPTLGEVDGLSAERLVVATGVEEREPVGASYGFDGTQDRLYAFLELRNDSAREREVTVSFEGPGGRETGLVTLTVPASVPRWRTWAFTRHATAPGAWSVITRTPDGEVLGRAPFQIEGAAPGS